jgi:hypothetical protein
VRGERHRVAERKPSLGIFRFQNQELIYSLASYVSSKRARGLALGGLSMWDHLKVFFDTTMFSPHGICLLWEPELLVVHIVSDTIIARATQIGPLNA